MDKVTTFAYALLMLWQPYHSSSGLVRQSTKQMPSKPTWHWSKNS
jgi:hypothetical protein